MGNSQESQLKPIPYTYARDAIGTERNLQYALQNDDTHSGEQHKAKIYHDEEKINSLENS